jgi:hypothetical protein
VAFHRIQVIREISATKLQLAHEVERRYVVDRILPNWQVQYILGPDRIRDMIFWCELKHHLGVTRLMQRVTSLYSWSRSAASRLFAILRGRRG